MELKSIDSLSAAKMYGILMGLVGFLVGGVLAVFSMVGIAAGEGIEGEEGILSVGAFGIVILPVMYGVLGAITGAIGALLYNLIAHVFGGVRITLDDSN